MAGLHQECFCGKWISGYPLTNYANKNCMQIDNDQWLEHLSDPDCVNAETLSSLRSMLFKGLLKSLGGREGIDEAFVEDVVQEAIIKILRNISSFEGRSKFTTWAMSIAIRTALTELKRSHWKDISLEQVVGDDYCPEGKRETMYFAEVNMEQKELLSKVSSLIETSLSERQRTALYAELNGMPQEEIGRRTGSNRNAVYKLVHDARKRLKKDLEEIGYSSADLESLLSR